MRLALLAAVAWLAACVPEYDPLADSAVEDAMEEEAPCQPLPADIGELVPAVDAETGLPETETGYDHRGGLPRAGDEGVIYHEAYLTRSDGRNTMLSFQDFRGDAVDRSVETVVDLWERYFGPELARGDSPDYLDCKVCVLFLVDCPFESLGACDRQFLAVAGTVTFDAFAKDPLSWRVDTLEELAVTLEGLEFKEVRIDPLTYFTTTPVHVCPGQQCDDPAAPEGDCLSVESYSFSFTPDG